MKRIIPKRNLILLAASWLLAAPVVAKTTRPKFSTAPPIAPQSAGALPGEKQSRDQSSALLDEIQKKSEALGVYSQASLGHTLGEGDVVEIKVYQEDELTTKSRVDSEGKITMPLLGAIHVGGRSMEAAQKLVRDLLERDYLRSPQVSMTLIEFAKERFSVLGEVNQPGFFMIPEGESMNVLQAIATAGGFTPYARSGEIIVKRKLNGREETIRVDAKEMAKTKRAPSLEIRGGDAIYVKQSLF
jgi:polysaccharide export outer membrane protein